MNIFLKELKSHRKSLLFWSIGSFLMVYSGMMKYEAYSSSKQSINDVIGAMPKSLRAVFGMGAVDLSKVSGYYGLLFVYLLLMAAIHAAMFGATIIAKEERDKTSEFLFAKPVSRQKVITAKMLAAFCNLLIFNLVTLVSSLMIVSRYSKGISLNGDIALLMAGMFIVQLLFLAIGSAIAAVKKRPRTASSLATGILLLMYLLSVVIDLNDKMAGLKFLTPFKYFEAGAVMADRALDPVYIVLSLAVTAVLVAVTYIFFTKRDLNV